MRDAETNERISKAMEWTAQLENTQLELNHDKATRKMQFEEREQALAHKEQLRVERRVREEEDERMREADRQRAHEEASDQRRQQESREALKAQYDLRMEQLEVERFHTINEKVVQHLTTQMEMSLSSEAAKQSAARAGGAASTTAVVATGVSVEEAAILRQDMEQLRQEKEALQRALHAKENEVATLKAAETQLSPRTALVSDSLAPPEDLEHQMSLASLSF
jgi:hypothetical protein